MRYALLAATAAFSLTCGTASAAFTHPSAVSAITLNHVTSAYSPAGGTARGGHTQTSRDQMPFATSGRLIYAASVRLIGTAHGRQARTIPTAHNRQTRTVHSRQTHTVHNGHGTVKAALHVQRARSAMHEHATSAHRSVAIPGVSAPKVEMLNLINAERAQAGLAPLAFDPTLNVVAQARSQDMIDRHYFSHQIPGGGMVFNILDRDHVQYQMAGENIALNNYISFYSMTQTVQLTNTDLMNSPEHRANILEPKYTRIGLGMAFESGTGKLILTEVFVQP